MTEDQVVAKIMKISSDLGLRGHQTIDKIIRKMITTYDFTLSSELGKRYLSNWKIGDQTSIELITEIERILTEKGILS